MPEPNKTDLQAKQIVSLLRNGHEKLKNRKQLSGIFISIAVLLAGLSIFVLLENSFFFSATLKSILLAVVLIASVLAGIILSNKNSVPGFRTFFEEFFTRNNLKAGLSAVDLYLDENQKSSRFYEAAIRTNLESINTEKLPAKITEFVDESQISSRYRISTGGFSAAVIALLLVAILLPAETLRTAHFWQGYIQPNPFVFTVSPADTVIEHGSSLPFTITYHDGSLPDRATLEFKTEVEESYRQRQMLYISEDTFESPAIDLTSSISYRFNMDGFLSEVYSVDVQLQPRFDELTAVVTPPAYTGLSPRTLEYPFSQISIYPGSELQISGSTNKPLKSMTLSGNEISMDIDMDGDENSFTSFTETITPEKPDTLFFLMVDTDGLENRNPYRTVINVREDQYPVVVIQEPSGTVMKTDPRDVDIFYQATDDFGLTRAELRWSHQRAFVEEAASGSKPLNRPRNGRTEQVNWNLEDFEMRPRDQLLFKIRVWDNDEISGYKWSESQEVVIQVPSLTEYFDDLDSRERDTQGNLDEISDQFRTMEEEYEQFLERLRQNPDGGFEEEQILEEIRERQRNMDESIKKLNESFEEMRREIEQNNNISDETRQAYRELQQLMVELDDPALREALEELQRAIEGLSQQELERALENVSFNENLYRERLERTVELFKRLKMNSDLDKLARQYEDMAERMLQGDESTSEQLARELETINQDLDNVSSQLDQLDSNPPQRSEEMLRNLKESAKQELEQIKEQLEQLMQDVRDGGETGDGESGAEGENNGEEETNGEGNGGSENSPSEQMQQQQQQISEQMQAEANRFRQSVEQMSGQQLQVNILALQQALYTLLELSNMQEYLTRTAAETRNRNQGFVDLARLQNNVSGQFSNVADTLYQVSAELAGLPNQINRKKAEVERTLGNSIDQMVERNQRGSTISTRESLGGINDLTSMIASLIDQLMDQQNGGGGGGMSMQQMIEQLQNMSGDQQQLNQQLQDLINDAQGDRLTQEQSDRLDQLARQQNEMRRQLQELQRSGALNQGDRVMSEMQRMIEEMENSINDMRGGITDPLMIDRQQNILSRMLSAEESLQQRGEDEEREGTDPSQYERVLPPDMTLEELQQEIRARMQDPNYTPFSEKYQRIIERYFERLRMLEDENLQ